MKKLSDFCILVLGMFFFQQTYAQQHYPRELVVADIDSLYTFFAETHLDIHAFKDRDEFLEWMDHEKSNLPEQVCIRQAYTLMTRMAASFGDGHTWVAAPVEQVSETDAAVFPYLVEIPPGQNLIKVKSLYNGQPGHIPRGAEVKAINGRKAPDIVDVLRDMVSGESLSFRMLRVQNLFSPLYYFAFGGNNFVVQYTFEGKDYWTEVGGEPFPEVVEWLSVHEGYNSPDRYFLKEMDPDGDYAVLEFNSFSYDDEWQLREFLDSAFGELKRRGIGNLVIDVRRNGGGNSRVGDEFFQYISPVPFLQFGTTIIKSSRFMGDDYWRDGGGVRVVKADGLIPLRDNPFRYTGNVYLLTSLATFSSAADFAWAFNYFNMGTIIGEETGGYVVCFGDTVPLRLANTGLQCGCSFKKFYPYGSFDGMEHGVKPHVRVEADKAMDVAREMILASRK